MTKEEIQKGIAAIASRAWWVGFNVGVILGLLARLAIGYKLGSPQTVVIPLSQGVRT